MKIWPNAKVIKSLTTRWGWSQASQLPPGHDGNVTESFVMISQCFMTKYRISDIKLCTVRDATEFERYVLYHTNKE